MNYFLQTERYIVLSRYPVPVGNNIYYNNCPINSDYGISKCKIFLGDE